MPFVKERVKREIVPGNYVGQTLLPKGLTPGILVSFC